MENRSKPRIFVTVGTDHHPFRRLIDWVDAWTAKSGVSCLVQHGSSPEPGAAVGVEFVSADELAREMREATVVVTHGGPGTIAAARRAGKKPIVVARDPALGEHVDDHQMRFVSRMSETSLIFEARTGDELSALLDRAVADPSSVIVEPTAAGDASAAARFGSLVEDLVAGRRGTEPGSRVTVLYIGGAGRSGSTLLDRLLGRLPGFVSAGEVVHLWRRGLLEDQLCGCGERFSDCPHWQKVGQLAFDGWGNVAPDPILALQRSADRNRYIPAMSWPRIAPRRASAIEDYGERLSPLYAAIADAADAKVVVDSSKHPSTAFLLARTPGIDLRLVHLVRDPRGVAYSWSRRVRRPEVVDRDEYMPSPGPVRSSFEWLAFNELFEGLRRTGIPSVRVRYEDLAQDTPLQMGRVLSLASDVVDANHGSEELGLPVAHTVSGNPMRFETGPLTVRVDEEWRQRMSPADRRLVDAIATPLLGRYGYRRSGR
jgi:UDP-N-acetylglucosamine transferase subunit ALG13